MCTEQVDEKLIDAQTYDEGREKMINVKMNYHPHFCVAGSFS
jgi:hypothetical protein